jgi:hypothetical protein
VKDLLRYDKMVETALRGVVREALARTVANNGRLPGAHHFYITFRTGAPGVAVPDYLVAQYPDEMTIVLEHKFWDLDVTEDRFSVKLSFRNCPEQLVIPFAAITAFADPAVKFGLQFQSVAGDAEAAAIAPMAASPAAEGKAEKPGEVVTLDAFRKK